MVNAPDSKGQALLSEIVATAGKLERVTDRYAELGRLCNEFITLRLGQVEGRSESKTARAAAVKELCETLQKSGITADTSTVSRWTKLYALVQLCPIAAELPRRTAEQLLPMVRVDARTGKPAISRGYESDLPKLAEQANKSKLTGDAVRDLVQTLRKSKLSPERAAKMAISAETRKADAERDKLAELLESASEADLAVVIQSLSQEAISRLVESIDVATGGQIDAIAESVAA